MNRPAQRRLLIAALALTVLLAVTAFVYSRQQHIAWSTLAVLLPALVIEATLYWATVDRTSREWAQRIAPQQIALALWGSALLTYGLWTAGAGGFEWQECLQLVGFTALASFWFFLPGGAWRDWTFLLLMAGPILCKIPQEIYRTADLPKDLGIVGQAQWIRLGLGSLLLVRRWPDAQLGFVPRAREWRQGVLAFLIAVPLLLVPGLATGFIEWRPVTDPLKPILIFAGTLVGILWVVALSEEVFFRGLLLRLVEQRSGRPWLALVVSSVLFGLVHLGFGTFPNWRFALVATLAGVVYGTVFQRTGSIRAAMVTHALTATTWRVLFR